jgi:hypothetical protein
MNQTKLGELLALVPPKGTKPTKIFDDVTTVAELRKTLIDRDVPIMATLISDKDETLCGLLLLIEHTSIPKEAYDKIKAFAVKTIKSYLKKGEKK